MAKLTFTFCLLAGILPLLLDSKFTSKQVKWNRSKRQAPIGILNPPIPTSIAHFIGSSQAIDKCPRDEVLMPDGKCYPLLTQGPCTITQYILLDPSNNEPYCAERLCAPDRIFIFSEQLCYDPRDANLCPPGRQLYETSYGTPICQCPAGTYEGDDDLDDDVCDPLLGQTLTCPPGQVFWFRDFSLPPECLQDPCGGDNLNRGPNDQPFVPFEDGRCFQLGTMPNVCPAQTWYSIALEKLQGVCTSLDDAGYEVFDEQTLTRLIEIYGPPIARDTTSPIPVPAGGSAPSQSTGTVGAGIPGAAGPAFGAGAAQSPGISTTGGTQGTFGTGAGTGSLGRPGSGGQGAFNQGLGAGNQGTFSGGTGVTNQGTLGGTVRPSSQGTFSGGPGTFSGGSGTGGQATLSQGQRPVTGGQGSLSQGPGFGSQGTFSGGSGVGGQGTFTGGSGIGNKGTFSQGSGIGSQGIGGGSGFGGQGTFSQGQGSGIGGQGTFSQGQGSGIAGQGTFSQGQGSGIGGQGTFSQGHGTGIGGQGPSIGGEGILSQGFNTGNQGITSGGSNFGSQGAFNGGFGAGGQGISQGVGGQGVSQGVGGQGTFTPINFPGSNIGPGFSPRPANPLLGNVGGVPSPQGSPSFTVNQGYPSSVLYDDQSLEQFGMYDDDGLNFRTSGSAVDLMITEGRLLADIDVPYPGGQDDVELLQAPPGHKLHGFFNSVRTLVNNGPHNRSRRSPLPHAAPGNVFETRLVGCRAGAARDINAKCRDTVLPPRTPASRPARAAPPVPPSPSCPSGQAINIRRMCEAAGSAVNSVNRFSLG